MNTTPKGPPWHPPTVSFAGSGAPPPPPAPGAPGASRWGNPPDPRNLEPGEIQGRFGRTEYGNRFTLVGSTLTKLTVTRPTILTPIGVPDEIVYYQFGKMPLWRTGNLPEAQAWDAPLKSSGCGICYLYAPGDWYIWSASTASVDYAQISAEDPGIAVRYLSEPGVTYLPNAVNAATRHLSGAAGVTVTIPANRNRRVLVIQNTSDISGNTTLRICVGPTTGFSTAAPAPLSVGNGLALSVLSSFELSGERLWRGAVTVGAAVAWTADTLELA